MKAIEIKKDIYWVGVVDWNLRTFHGHTYATNRGSTYNAYLIRDDKNVLIDTVLAAFAPECIERISSVLPPEKIDYIIVNHVEMDHSGALPEILKLCPKAKLFGTAKCKEGLQKHYYGDWDFQVVKTGDTISSGKHTFTFMEAPMIHWPDSMFTYCPQVKVLFPNDAFGQHYASSERFDDETDACALMDEAVKYYANILWPLSTIIGRKLEEVVQSGIAIDMIAPSHGIIWRKEPQKILSAYSRWAKNTTSKKAVIVYETMWGSTAKMAGAIAEALSQAGVIVKLYDVALSDRTQIITEMLDAKVFLFGSSTHDNDLLTTEGAFLEFLKGLAPKNRLTGAFGSYGWAGGAVKHIEKILQEAGMPVAVPSLSIKYVPDAKELEACAAFGRSFAKLIQETA